MVSRLLGLSAHMSIGTLAATLAGQRDRWFLWYPVAVVTGVSVYFALPREPHLLVFFVAGLIAAVCFLVLQRHRASLKLLLTLCLLLGFIAAKVRTEYVQPKTLLATTPTIMITGTVDFFERKSGRRSKLILRLEKADGIKASALPELI